MGSPIGGFFLAGKGTLEDEVDHSLSSSVNVKNQGVYASAQ